MSGTAYARTFDPAWTQAITGWRGSLGSNSVTIHGPCPRCQHDTGYSQLRSVLVGVSTTDTESTFDRTFRVDCDCGEPHEGRKDNEKGCGVQFYPRATGDGPTLTVTPSDASLAPSEADVTAVAAAAAGELEGARKYADTWQKALAGLVALTATFLFLEGTKSPAKLEHPGVIAFLAVLGLVSAIYAALEAASGAHSRPVAVEVLGAGAAARIAEARSAQARESLAAVDRATIATLLAVGLLTAAIVGTWATTKSGLSSVSITADGREQPVCGDIATSNEVGVIVEDGNGAKIPVLWEDVLGMSVTSEC